LAALQNCVKCKQLGSSNIEQIMLSIIEFNIYIV
jgi:hypothetical protein